MRKAIEGKKIPFLLSCTGFVYTLTDLILWLNHASVCSTEGCKLIGTFTRFGESIFLLAGVLLFALLSFLFYSLLKTKICVDYFLKQVIDLIFFMSMAVEGYLVSFQLFTAHITCLYCLSVFGLFILTAFSYLIFYRRIEVVFTFFIFVSVFIVGYFVSFPTTGLNKVACTHIINKGNPQERCYLFSGKDCKHCERVVEFCKKEYTGDLSLYLCSAEKCLPTLKSLGVSEVPAMLVEDVTGKKKEILMGSNFVLRFFQSRQLLKPWEMLDFNGICKIGEPCR
jgi:hypothetical protein